MLALSGLFAMLTASPGLAVQCKTVASGNWSDPSIWQNSSTPQSGDDVIITAATDVTLDIATPDLDSVTLLGWLHGSTGVLRIAGAFTGSGAWSPDTSRVVLISTSLQSIDNAWPGQYYDLTLADSASVGPRELLRSIEVEHDLVGLFTSDTIGLSGTGNAQVAHNLFYVGASLRDWAGTLRFVSATAGRDTSFFVAHLPLASSTAAFVLPRVIIAKNDSSLVRLGWSRARFDTLYASNASDTILRIESGTFDMQGGWISLTEPVTSTRPIISVARNAQLRVAAPLPIFVGALADPTFDSTHTPLFALDSGSTFEYYSYASDVIDASYLVNNIVGHTYANLTIGSNAIASLWANPVTVRGTLHIEYGATIIPKHIKVLSAGQAEQHITLYGDVMNDAPGPSGASGFYGGIVSVGTDVWTFASDRTDNRKDTLHWSGPSQLGTVIIQPNVVLSVRHVSDTLFDSLDILNSLVEMGKPCGGHLLGTVYSEVPVTFGASHTSDSLHGFGLFIRSGSPYPSRVRVTRTSGYAPPGSDPTANPVLRYYATYAQGGEQMTPDTIAAEYHCDELIGSSAGTLSLWRSREKWGAWEYLGHVPQDASGALVWQTTLLYPEGTSRAYSWMFAEGYRDIPTAVELLSFSANRASAGVRLDWSTASETDLLGFEVERQIGDTLSRVVSWENSTALRSQSAAGAKYSVVDSSAVPDLIQYRLFQVSEAGIRTEIASRTLYYAPGEALLHYAEGRLLLPDELSSSTLKLYDLAGRLVGAVNADGRTSVAISLRPGVYLIVGSSDRASQSLFVAP